MSRLANVAKNIKGSLSFDDYEGPDEASVQQMLGMPASVQISQEALPDELSGQLEKILFDFAKKTDTEASIQKDLKELKGLTAEVYSISKQAVLFQGERISKAREILRRYGNGKGFVRWVDTVFRNRKTAYNFLAYYEFHLSLPDPLKPKYLSMPLGPAYMLASRTGEPKIKEDIVSKYDGQKASDAKLLIHSYLPLETHDRRMTRSATDRLVDQLENACKSVQKEQGQLSTMDKERIATILQPLVEYCSDR